MEQTLLDLTFFLSFSPPFLPPHPCLRVLLRQILLGVLGHQDALKLHVLVFLPDSHNSKELTLSQLFYRTDPSEQIASLCLKLCSPSPLVTEMSRGGGLG